MANKGPIFIGGLGRSGTTLLALMLDSHNAIKCGPELHFRAPYNLHSYIAESMNFLGEKDYHANYRPGVMFVQRVKRFGIMPEELRRMLFDRPDRRVRSFRARCALIDRLAILAMEKAAKIRWGLKIMTDIGSHLEEYAEQWPGAFFIHVIKDPRDNVNGLLKVNWGPDSVEGAADQWIRAIVRSRDKARKNKIPLYEVNFNELVLDTETTIRKLLGWLGEEYDPNVLRHHEMPHTFIDHPAGHPSAEQVNHPIDATYIGRFKQGLSAKEIKTIEKMTMPYIKELGYLNAGVA